MQTKNVESHIKGYVESQSLHCSETHPAEFLNELVFNKFTINQYPYSQLYHLLGPVRPLWSLASWSLLLCLKFSLIKLRETLLNFTGK